MLACLSLNSKTVQLFRHERAIQPHDKVVFINFKPILWGVDLLKRLSVIVFQVYLHYHHLFWTTNTRSHVTYHVELIMNLHDNGLEIGSV